MIFVTVGTHEQPFDRLIKKIDELKFNGVIKEDVFIQLGYCNYIPKNCEYVKFLPYDLMIEKIQLARIVITHGGPASFIQVLKDKKIPIVIPREKKFNEHINDHQLEFCKFMESRENNLIIVEQIDQLEYYISNYDETVSTLSKNLKNNNQLFNEKLEEIVDEIF